MKIRIASVIGLAILLMLAMGPGTVTAAEPVPSDAALVPFPLYLEVTFCWEGSECAGGMWTINRDRTYSDDHGGYGTWTANRKTKQAWLQYQTGCLPLYEGTLQYKWHLAGTMACTDGSTKQGTWEADYVGHGHAHLGPASTASAGSPSQPPR